MLFNPKKHCAKKSVKQYIPTNDMAQKSSDRALNEITTKEKILSCSPNFTTSSQYQDREMKDKTPTQGILNFRQATHAGTLLALQDLTIGTLTQIQYIKPDCNFLIKCGSWSVWLWKKSYNRTMFSSQHNTKSPFRGYDHNVLPVWGQGVTGKNVVVSILDDGKYFFNLCYTCMQYYLRQYLIVLKDAGFLS